MLTYLKDALPPGTTLAALVAVGGKAPRQCVIVGCDELGVALRWDTLPETYLLPWARVEAVILKPTA